MIFESSDSVEQFEPFSKIQDPRENREETDNAIGEVAGAGRVAFSSDGFGVHLDYFRRKTDDIEIPGFAGMTAAYDALSDGTKARLDGLTAVQAMVLNTLNDDDGAPAGRLGERVQLTSPNGIMMT